MAPAGYGSTLRRPMPRLSRSRRDCVALAALAFAVALAQRPGTATSDTKIDLHVDPVGFLADVASVWSPTGDLGHVQGGQYTGYLFPMGPVFALGHWLGLAPWLVHRLWLGLVLVIAVVGAARLVDALLPDRWDARAADGGRGDAAQPVRRGVREPDVDHAAGVRAAAVDAAGGPSRAAPSAELVVAGGVRADRRRGGRRRERGRDRVAAARAGGAARVRAADRARRRGGTRGGSAGAPARAWPSPRCGGWRRWPCRRCSGATSSRSPSSPA